MSKSINKIQLDVSNLLKTNIIQDKLLTEQSKIKNLKALLSKFISEIEQVYECPIKHDKIIDPVLTPNGVTYENFAITKYVKTSKLDPLTKAKLTPSKLIPNLAIKKLITLVNRYRDIVYKLDENEEVFQTLGINC